MTPIVELRRVSRTFGPQAVLRDVTLPVNRGETLVIIGESGCGKSVTLKLLMRLMDPTSGEVLWNGRSIAPLSDRELSRERLRFGYLFQMAALFDSLTVYENVAFGLRQNRNLPEEHVRQIVRDRLRDVGLSLDVVEHKKPAQLSGGMKKRVGLARAMALDPEVVLYDEPTTGLDPIMADVINNLIVDCVKRLGATTISITHDMASARKIADDIAMIYKGEIMWQGPAKTIDESGNPYVEQFIHGRAEGPIKMDVLKP